MAHYYGYNEMGKAFDNAKLFLSANLTSTVNVVGHSLGGWQAAHSKPKRSALKYDPNA